MGTLAFLIATVGAIIAFGAKRYQQRLAGTKGWDLRRFVAEFSACGVPAHVSTAVYEYYKDFSNKPDFGVAPSFGLWRVFRQSEEDVDDNALEILHELGLVPPDEATLRSWTEPLVTVADIVRWVDWVSRNQPH